jgi:hypothetical protein
VAVSPPGSHFYDDRVVEFVMGEKRRAGSGNARGDQKLAGPHGKRAARTDDLARTTFSYWYTG